MGCGRHSATGPHVWIDRHRYALTAGARLFRSMLAGLCLVSAAAQSSAQQSDPAFDPATGFRIQRYRAPTPQEAPAGATRIAVQDVAALVRDQRAILIDAMPAEGAGPDPATGRWRLTKPREHIPGSVWLPDVGKGVLSPDMERYFKSELERLTAGDRARALIFYCIADCWMGWNAVKRAAAYGYTHLYWFAEGTDDWRAWEETLVPAEPVPLKR